MGSQRQNYSPALIERCQCESFSVHNACVLVERASLYEFDVIPPHTHSNWVLVIVHHTMMGPCDSNICHTTPHHRMPCPLQLVLPWPPKDTLHFLHVTTVPDPNILAGSRRVSQQPAAHRPQTVQTAASKHYHFLDFFFGLISHAYLAVVYCKGTAWLNKGSIASRRGTDHRTRSTCRIHICCCGLHQSVCQ